MVSDKMSTLMVRAHVDFNGVKIEDLALKNIYDVFPGNIADICRKCREGISIKSNNYLVKSC